VINTETIHKAGHETLYFYTDFWCRTEIVPPYGDDVTLMGALGINSVLGMVGARNFKFGMRIGHQDH